MSFAHTHLDVCENYKAGDPPPRGYREWHEWANVQSKAGLRQATCGVCGLWRFPQELSDRIIEGEVETSGGLKYATRSPVCLACNEKFPECS